MPGYRYKEWKRPQADALDEAVLKTRLRKCEDCDNKTMGRWCPGCYAKHKASGTLGKIEE